MIFPNLKKDKGFTLIETFVAITILLIAVLIPLGVMSKAIEDGLFIKNKVIAYYLAQEGMELIINQVDSNIKSIGDGESSGWLDYMSSCVNSKCYGEVDLDSNKIYFGSCNYSDGCPYLTQEQAGAPYGYGESFPETIFKRSIKILPAIISSTGEEMAIPVEVTINWKNKSGMIEQELILDDYVFNAGYDIGQ
ncbi:MAG: type II secretion system GspH family protein [Candidatus Vogelbacteria bacterium]|nr:type II secretion system GspH family protein [Candidatus Vogelbacteria bacterium]